jgi:hypothetical protein
MIRTLFKEPPNVELSTIQEVRSKAVNELKEARATLNGEDNWFLCIEKIKDENGINFKSCVPRKVTDES